jgi:hypothetical protein
LPSASSRIRAIASASAAGSIPFTVPSWENKVCSNQRDIANAATNIENVHPLFQAGAHEKITREIGE